MVTALAKVPQHMLLQQPEAPCRQARKSPCRCYTVSGLCRRVDGVLRLQVVDDAVDIGAVRHLQQD